MSKSSKDRSTRRSPKRGRRRRRALVVGAAAGAAITYLVDPDQGRHRRAQLRDKTRSARRDVAETAEIIARDGRNRARGLVIEAERLFRDELPGDARIHHQVREEIGAASRHPRSIGVRVVDGQVTLTGPVLSDEVDRVRTAVYSVPGVESVDDRLEVHDTAGNIPALQGEGRLTGGPRPELFQQHWAPAPRALAGAVGGILMAYGLGRRGLTGLVVTASGGLLLARAVTNLPVRQLTGVGFGPEAVEVSKTIDVDAPVEQVWAFWEDYESFPTFMSHVRDVRGEGDGRSHWTVDGPLGAAVEWDAEVVEHRPNEVLAWRSRPGTPVQHAGAVSFEPSDRGSRVHVRMAYNPAAGVAGHAVACLLGADPKKQLDDDLLRMKTMIETGRRPHDAVQA